MHFSIKEIGQPRSHKRKQAYQIGKHIGAGEFGEVKLAIDTASHEEVAVKIVPKSNYRSLAAQAQRLANYATISHPNVLKLLEWFESRDRYYFVLQYMAGGELYDMVEKKGHLPEDEARALVIQILSAVQYLHTKGIVHRDLKLENILVDASHTHLVVGDLGLSAVLEQPTDQLYAQCGSLGYTAPEVYAKTGYSKPVDMWSIGVITFLLLGGRFPFIGADPIAVAQEGMEGRIRFTAKEPWISVSTQAKLFIKGLLNPIVDQRMTADQALRHPWITQTTSKSAVIPSHEQPDTHEDGGDLAKKVTTLSPGLALQRTTTHIEPQEQDMRNPV